MTKKDYVKIAAVLRDSKQYVTVYMLGPLGRSKATETHRDQMRHRIAEELAVMLAADNPRFDRAEFLAACDLSR